jgi:hypothetical protein
MSFENTKLNFYIRKISTYDFQKVPNVTKSEYKAWQGIIQRCTNPHRPNWMNYGGRGIEMYRPWRESFECFFKHVYQKYM